LFEVVVGLQQIFNEKTMFDIEDDD